LTSLYSSSCLRIVNFSNHHVPAKRAFTSAVSNLQLQLSLQIHSIYFHISSQTHCRAHFSIRRAGDAYIQESSIYTTAHASYDSSFDTVRRITDISAGALSEDDSDIGDIPFKKTETKQQAMGMAKGKGGKGKGKAKAEPIEDVSNAVAEDDEDEDMDADEYVLD